MDKTMVASPVSQSEGSAANQSDQGSAANQSEKGPIANQSNIESESANQSNIESESANQSEEGSIASQSESANQSETTESGGGDKTSPRHRRLRLV